MWRWRDWVIDAFNAQHAVRPVHHRAARRRPAARTPTLDQKIATGFNRNHCINAEGGIDPGGVPRRVRRRPRRTRPATVWLGLTLGCARATTTSTTRSRRRSSTSSSRSSTTCRRTGIDGRDWQLDAVHVAAPREAARTRSWPSPRRSASLAADEGARGAASRQVDRGWRSSSSRRRPTSRRAATNGRWSTCRSTEPDGCRDGARRHRRLEGWRRQVRRRADRPRGRRSTARATSPVEHVGVGSRRTTRSPSARWVKPDGRQRRRRSSRRMDEADARARLRPLLAAGMIDVQLMHHVAGRRDHAGRRKPSRRANAVASRLGDVRRLGQGGRRARSTSTASRVEMTRRARQADRVDRHDGRCGSAAGGQPRRGSRADRRGPRLRPRARADEVAVDRRDRACMMLAHADDAAVAASRWRRSARSTSIPAHRGQQERLTRSTRRRRSAELLSDDPDGDGDGGDAEAARDVRAQARAVRPARATR